MTQAAGLLHGQEQHAWGDAGYQGVDKRQEHQGRQVHWSVAMRPGKRRLLDRDDPVQRLQEQVQRLNAGIRAKVEHPFRIIKQQFGYAKVRYRGLAKNTARLTMLFALGNLWMARGKLQQARG